MNEVKEALQKIKEGVEALDKYCDSGTMCAECLLRDSICHVINFEYTFDAIEEWQNKHD